MLETYIEAQHIKENYAKVAKQYVKQLENLMKHMQNKNNSTFREIEKIHSTIIKSINTLDMLA